VEGGGKEHPAIVIDHQLPGDSTHQMGLSPAR
jgi:hypothetical protein